MLYWLLLLSTLVCAFIVVYPFIVYPLVLKTFTFRPLKKGSPNAGTGNNYSLLFCAFNEANSLPQKIKNLKELKNRYPDIEVLAYDDGSNDDTAAIIEETAPFVNLVKGPGRLGKAHGMKKLAAMAKGEFLIFTDANVLVHLDALDELDACYADPGVGGVCGSLHYLGAESSTTAAVGGAYWRLEEKIKALESSTGSVIGADGSIFSIRAFLYPEFPDTVLDDFTVSMEVVFRGYRLIKSSDVIAYENLVESRKDEFNRKIRIAARSFHTHLVLKKKRSTLSARDKFKYFSHKLLRWFSGAFLALGAFLGLLFLALYHTYIFGLAVVVLIVIGFLYIFSSVQKINSIAEIVVAMFATLIGVVKALRGQTVVVWNPAKSR